MQAVGAEQHGSAEAQGDVCGVRTGDRLGGDLEEEVGLPQVVLEGGAKGVGVGQAVPELGQLTGGVGEDDGQGELADVGEVGDPERVPGLGVPVVAATVRTGPGVADAVDLAVDPVDVDPVDDQPAAAVDPRSPLAPLGDLRVRPSDVAGDGAEGGGVEVAAVVEPEVDVRLGGVLPAGAAAAEDHSDDTVDRGETAR